MRSVLIITSNYSPELIGIGPYATDLSRNLSELGMKVTVITSRPHYPNWIEQSYDPSIDSEILNVTVKRGNHSKPRSGSIIPRVIFELSMAKSMIQLIIRSKKKEQIDFIVCIIPSLACGFAAVFAKKVLKIPLKIIVQDVTYLALTESGIRGGKIIRGLAWGIEKKILLHATQICCISEAMRQEIRLLTSGKVPVVMIPNYRIASATEQNEVNHKNSFPSSITEILKLEDAEVKFRVIYTGAISNKQDLGDVAKAAKALEGFPQIVFHIVGAGPKVTELKLETESMSNIHIHNLVPASDYTELLNLADALLVSERKTMGSMALPSKIISYLFARKPIVAYIPKESATWGFLSELAILVERDDYLVLARRIKEIYDNPKLAKELAKSSHEYASTELATNRGWDAYRNWLFPR